MGVSNFFQSRFDGLAAFVRSKTGLTTARNPLALAEQVVSRRLQPDTQRI